MNINYDRIIDKLIPILIITLMSYTLSVIISLFLPKTYPLSLSQGNSTTQIVYNKYQIFSSFQVAQKKELTKTQENKKEEYRIIDNITLQAVYAYKDPKKGFISIMENSSKKTHILSVEDSFKEYKLEKIYPRYVVFERNGINYKLELKASTDDKFTIEEKVDDLIQSTDNSFQVQRGLIQNYVKEPQKIFKEISIKEFMNGGKIDGFIVTRVKKDSVMSKLGLKKNDIIKKVNNISLTSYADAYKMYNNLDKTEFMNFQILRDNQLMEIEYEIK